MGLVAALAGVVVASPVEDWILAVDALPAGERAGAMGVVRPLLDALGGRYSAPAEGSAFYALQSCANHDCAPNAHALKVLTGRPA